MMVIPMPIRAYDCSYQSLSIWHKPDLRTHVLMHALPQTHMVSMPSCAVKECVQQWKLISQDIEITSGWLVKWNAGRTDMQAYRKPPWEQNAFSTCVHALSIHALLPLFTTSSVFYTLLSTFTIFLTFPMLLLFLHIPTLSIILCSFQTKRLIHCFCN